MHGLRRCNKAQMSHPFFIGGLMRIFSDITGEMYTVDNWNGLDLFLCALEGD
jgi:hypothetical protein